jgi:hypothetical protein
MRANGFNSVVAFWLVEVSKADYRNQEHIYFSNIVPFPMGIKQNCIFVLRFLILKI